MLAPGAITPVIVPKKLPANIASRYATKTYRCRGHGEIKPGLMSVAPASVSVPNILPPRTLLLVQLGS